MVKFIVKRILSALITIFFVITIVFFLTKLTPGKPFASEKMSPEAIKEMEHIYGFDRPLFVQYVDYLRHLIFYGDLGLSTGNLHSSVNEIIFPKGNDSAFYLSMKFGFIVIFFVVILGILLGIVAALNPNGIADRCIGSQCNCAIQQAVRKMMRQTLLGRYYLSAILRGVTGERYKNLLRSPSLKTT